MIEKYRDFTIQKDEWQGTYGNEHFTFTKYVVYKEIDGVKYFLPGVTAFDTMKEARDVIDGILATNNEQEDQ